jgi:hypothetical protein
MDGQDDAIDWRARAVTTLAKDVPAAYPGGPSHRAGARVVLVTSVKSADPGGTSFTTPSGAALALSIAIKAFDAAVVAKGQLGFVEIVTPRGPGKAIADERIPAFFDFLEQCMIMVTFSFQALEAYCNQIIDERLDGAYRYTKKTKTGV